MRTEFIIAQRVLELLDDVGASSEEKELAIEIVNDTLRHDGFKATRFTPEAVTGSDDVS